MWLLKFLNVFSTLKCLRWVRVQPWPQGGGYCDDENVEVGETTFLKACRYMYPARHVSYMASEYNGRSLSNLFFHDTCQFSKVDDYSFLPSEAKEFLQVLSNDERIIAMLLTDYGRLYDRLSADHSFSSEEVEPQIKKDPFPIHDGDFRVANFFQSPKNAPSTKATFHKLYTFKNSSAHSTFSEEEFDHCIKLCQRNNKFLERFDIKFDQVVHVINDLQLKRRNGHNRFIFTRKEKKKQ